MEFSGGESQSRKGKNIFSLFKFGESSSVEPRDNEFKKEKPKKEKKCFKNGLACYGV